MRLRFHSDEEFFNEKKTLGGFWRQNFPGNLEKKFIDLAAALAQEVEPRALDLNEPGLNPALDQFLFFLLYSEINLIKLQSK